MDMVASGLGLSLQGTTAEGVGRTPSLAELFPNRMLTNARDCAMEAGKQDPSNLIPYI